ncbi:hypothetical protein E4T43_06082 [Aureobasidium subglaciale]|nr:hypothetical protein E4T43_06082 [Aureobasidium subglaciale]
MCDFRSRSSKAALLLDFVPVQKDIDEGGACTERQTPSRCRIFRSHSTIVIVRQIQALAFTLARSTFIVYLKSLPCCHQLIFSPLPLLIITWVRSTPLPVQGQYQQQVYISTTSNKQQQPIIPNHNHNQINMSSARPEPRPSMMSDLPNKWLWCDDNAKVNRWFQHEVNRHRYRVFYSSFINACNRVWVISVDKNSTHKLQPLEHLMIDCLLEERIPADMLIDVLQKYNHFIGGTRGELKNKSLIKWDVEAPKDSQMEKGVEKLYKVVADSWKKSRSGNINDTTLVQVKKKTEPDDEDMEDAEVKGETEDDQPLLSLDDIDAELIAAGNAPTLAPVEKVKGKNPVKFGEIPMVGGKKDEDSYMG